jgi:imidazolonepropionase-like amidohydrolase
VIVEEAERMGTYVSTHAQSNAGVYNSVKAGVKCIEHGYMTTDETQELMLKNDCYQVPTLSAMTVLLDKVNTMQPHIQEKIRRVVPNTYESVSRAHKAGIRMATGADFLSVPGMGEYGQNGQELVELVNVGFSPMEAIVAATKIGSELMLMSDKIGTLEKNKLADLIVICQNPLDNIKCITQPNNIKMVIKDGVIEKHII